MLNGLMGNGSNCCLIEFLIALTQWREIACVRIFIDSPFCGLKHHEIQSYKCKQPLPINSLGIVTYAFLGQPFSKQLYIEVQVRN